MAASFPLLSIKKGDSLPPLAISKLDNWGLITVTGDDKTTYLNGQVTCDVSLLTEDAITFGGHCDAKGKLWSIFQLFHYNNGYALFQRKSTIDVCLTEIKKYAVFSKVEIESNTSVLIGISGIEATSWVDKHTSNQKEVRISEHGTFAKISETQWLLITSTSQFESIISAHNQYLYNESLWELHQIKQHLPQLDLALVNEYIPQALNLQDIEGISFTKGCYTGQETVARAKYRGINKRAMFLLSGQSETKPLAGDTIERSVGENWRQGGVIVSSYRFEDGNTLALAILPNNLDVETQFKLQEHIWIKEKDSIN